MGLMRTYREIEILDTGMFIIDRNGNIYRKANGGTANFAKSDEFGKPLEMRYTQARDIEFPVSMFVQKHDLTKVPSEQLTAELVRRSEEKSLAW